MRTRLASFGVRTEREKNGAFLEIEGSRIFMDIGQFQGRSSIFRRFLEFYKVTPFSTNVRAPKSGPVQELELS